MWLEGGSELCWKKALFCCQWEVLPCNVQAGGRSISLGLGVSTLSSLLDDHNGRVA